MKTPKKIAKKPSAKGQGAASEEVKKIKLKPLNPKDSKNWKNKINEEEDDDFELPLDEIEDFGADFDDYDEDDRF